MSKDEEQLEKPKFLIPNTFQVPNILCDELLAELSGSELKVVLYIIRRTFGFQKEADNISLSQMLNGIRRKDGTYQDRGVGLTKKPLLEALRKLHERRLIHTERRRSVERGDEPTTYRLTISDWQTGDDEPPSSQTPSGEAPPPVGEKLHQGGGGETPPGPWGRNSTTQNQAIQNPVEQNPLTSNYLEGGTTHKHDGSDIFSKKRDVRNFDDQEDEAAPEQGSEEDDRGDYAPLTPKEDGFSSVKEVLTRRKTAPRSPKTGPRAADGGGSGPKSQKAAGRASRRPQATPYIESLIAQFSQEFHDEHAVESNLGQAARLYQASGLSEEQFVARLYEARSITKDRGNIHKPAKGQAGELGLRNRGAYYFKVLRDLLGMKEQAEHADQARSSRSVP